MSKQRKETRNLYKFMHNIADGEKIAIMDKMQKQINYLLEKIAIYEERFHEITGNAMPELTAIQKKRLAHIGKTMERTSLELVEKTFSPATILSWYHDLIGKKYDSSKIHPEHKRGPKPISEDVVKEVLRIAESSPDWGYERIAAYMKYLNSPVSASTVKSILDDYGIFPDPERDRNGDWRLFFNVHFDSIMASDAASIEVVMPHGELKNYQVLFFERLSSREVWLAGITDSPTAQWLENILRAEMEKKSSFLKDVSYLIHDRGSVYRGDVHRILKAAGIKGKRLPVRSPDLNAYMESFVKSFKRECADHIVFTSAAQLEYCTREYLEWYNHERPHRGLGGQMIHPRSQDPDGEIVEFSRLGGLLKSYRRVKLAA